MSERPHTHGAGQGADSERRIRLVFFLTASFMLIEAAGFRVARRPADARRSYGYHRDW